jgi:hypothetical protein
MLNPDAFVESADQVVAMADWLAAHPDVAAIGPKLVNADGSHQVGDAGWRVSLSTLIAHNLFLQRLIPGAPSLYLTSSAVQTRPFVDVDWVCGACAMIRKEIISAVGGLDESIFMYGEDVEWGTRMREAGWRVVYLPQYLVMHLQGATQKGDQAIFYSTKWIDSTLTEMAKRSGRIELLVARLVFALGFILRGVIYRIDGLLRRRTISTTRSAQMWRYLRHVVGNANSGR